MPKYHNLPLTWISQLILDLFSSGETNRHLSCARSPSAPLHTIAETGKSRMTIYVNGGLALPTIPSKRLGHQSSLDPDQGLAGLVQSPTHMKGQPNVLC